MHIYLVILAVLLIISGRLIRIVYSLLRNKSVGKYILNGNNIYKIVLKPCPICGKTCGGKLKIMETETGAYYVCHRDKTHRWKIEYNDVMNMISQ